MGWRQRARGERGPLDYAARWPLRLWVGAVLLFLYVPLASLVLFSFNNARRTIRWEGFTTDWYAKMAGDDALIGAFANSLTIAAMSTVVSVVLGAMAAIALWRFRFPGKGLFDGMITLPIVVPEICMGVAMLVFFGAVLPWPRDLAWPLDLGAITIAHITFSFPFVTVVVRARLASFNREMEEAARDLGAGELHALYDVVLPHLRPALIAGALLAFTLSLDDFVITFFTAGPNTVTFPVKIYSMVRFSVTPEVNAASTVLMAITVVLTLIGMALQGTAIARTEGA
jgi:spermidine/putrescine transport system permease protein